VPIGIGSQGEVWCALTTLGHTLIAGTTGSGKSTWVHAALAALLLHNGPAQLQLALVDPKRSEFAVWAGVPQLVEGVAHDEATAGALLARLVAELDRRSELLAGALARDLARYNGRAAESLPYLLLVIDEVLDLLLTAGERSALSKDLTRLVVKGRAAGIFVWVASQHARFDLLPRAVNVNLGSRLVFRVADDAAARLAGCPGAQQIPRTRPGRMLARLEGEPVPVQGYHVDEATMQQVAARLREPGPSARLSAAELALVRYAIEQLDGCFIVGKLAAAFAGEWTHYRIATLARTWEARGWLSKPAHATDPRRVTAELDRE
jgi:DNA segregation ATPase FtsK/SpoIIIE-like protein